MTAAQFNAEREAELRRLLNTDAVHRAMSGRLIIPPVAGWPPWHKPYWGDWDWRWQPPIYFDADGNDTRKPNPAWVADPKPTVHYWEIDPKVFRPSDDDKNVNEIKQTDHLEKIRLIVRQRSHAREACADAMTPLRETWAAVRDECPHARTVTNEPTSLTLRWGCCMPAWIWKAEYDAGEDKINFSATTLKEGLTQYFPTALAMLEAFYEHCADFGAFTPSPYSSAPQFP